MMISIEEVPKDGESEQTIKAKEEREANIQAEKEQARLEKLEKEAQIKALNEKARLEREVK